MERFLPTFQTKHTEKAAARHHWKNNFSFIITPMSLSEDESTSTARIFTLLTLQDQEHFKLCVHVSESIHALARIPALQNPFPSSSSSSTNTLVVGCAANAIAISSLTAPCCLQLSWDRSGSYIRLFAASSVGATISSLGRSFPFQTSHTSHGFDFSLSGSLKRMCCQHQFDRTCSSISVFLIFHDVSRRKRRGSVAATNLYLGFHVLNELASHSVRTALQRQNGHPRVRQTLRRTRLALASGTGLGEKLVCHL